MTSRSLSLRRDARPRLEALEDRCVPALFGQPWSDPEHLTLSLAPDTTLLAGQQSRLFGTLDAQLPRAAWQRVVLQAFQTWAVQANLNIGVVPDGGADFGAAGRTQGDARFGDIRLGAEALSADALAVAVPHDPLLSGTWTGDVFVNSAARFTAARLFTVLLHEAGHVFGLDESADPRSVMYPVLGQPKPFTAQDLALLRGLYGPRTPDIWETLRGNKGNETLATATRIKTSDVSDPYDGKTPLVTFGDITTTRDLDNYWLTPLTGYSGPVTFRLQTAGISLLAPSLTVLDQRGRVVGRAASVNPAGGTVAIHLARVVPGARYYLHVQGAVHNVFGIGRYALVVTFDKLVQTTPAQLGAFLRSAPSGLDRAKDDAISDPAHALLEPDAGANDTALTAVDLRPRSNAVPATHAQALGSLEAATDVDFYRLRAPKTGNQDPFVLVVSLNTAALNGVLPQVTLLDANFNPLPAQVLVNSRGTFTVEATGLPPGKDVYLRVASPAGQTGNYTLQADFGGRALQPRGFALGSLQADRPAATYSLFVAHTQLMQFTLAADSLVAGSTAAARLDLRDAQGQIVLTLRARGGETFTADAQLLPPGAYSATLTLEPGAGGQLDGMNFRVVGFSLSNPIGPAVVNPLVEPQYVSPNDPTTFIYPGSWPSTDSFMWMLIDPAGYLVIPAPSGSGSVNAYPLAPPPSATPRPGWSWPCPPWR
jgi:hypothetical protein